MADQIVVEFWLVDNKDMMHFQHYKLGSPMPRVGEEIVFGPSNPSAKIYHGVVKQVMTDMIRDVPSVVLWIKLKK